jgi:hypothetical protein
MKVQSKFVLFSTTFILAIASNAMVAHSAHAGLFDSPKERLKNAQAKVDRLEAADDKMGGRYARAVGRRDKLATKVAQQEGRDFVDGTDGKADIKTQFITETDVTFPVHRKTSRTTDQGDTDQNKTTNQGSTDTDDTATNESGHACIEKLWTDHTHYVCKEDLSPGDCAHDKGTDQGTKNTDQGKKTDQGATSCTDPNTVWNPATGYCEPKTVHCDLTKTEYNPRTNSCDPLPDNGCDDDETFVEGKGCVKDPLPPVKPTKPTKPVRPPNKKGNQGKIPPTKNPNQGKIPPVKTKTIPTQVRKPHPKKKPTTPVVTTPPCEDELNKAAKENERLKQEQMAKDKAQHDKDEANRIAQEAKDKASADELDRVKKQAEQDNVPMIGKSKLKVSNHFNGRVWDANTGSWVHPNLNEKFKTKPENLTVGQAKALVKMGEEMNDKFVSNVTTMQKSFGISDDNTLAADMARKAAKANTAN